jgi:hypothetical protein
MNNMLHPHLLLIACQRVTFLCRVSGRFRRGAAGRRLCRFKALAGEQKEQKEGAMQFAFCRAHARRKLFEFHYATGSPIAAEALRRIAEFYEV